MSTEPAPMSTVGSVPVPDPTALTTAAMLREISGLKELVNQRIESIEKAVALAHENLVRVPTDVDKAIGHLSEVINERFATIRTQFVERDVRVEQTARASKEALDAALAAAKEAVGTQNASFVTSIAKSETATAKQIDALALTMTATSNATNDKIDDLKDRLTLLEGQDRGKSTAVVAQHAAVFNAANIWGIILGVIGTLTLLASLMLTVISHK